MNLDSTHDGTYSQYIYCGIYVTYDKLSFGLVFWYVMGEVTYSESTHRMTNNIQGSKYDYGNLYDNFDEGRFTINLRSTYIDKCY